MSLLTIIILAVIAILSIGYCMLSHEDNKKAQSLIDSGMAYWDEYFLPWGGGRNLKLSAFGVLMTGLKSGAIKISVSKSPDISPKTTSQIENTTSYHISITDTYSNQSYYTELDNYTTLPPTLATSDNIYTRYIYLN